MSPSIGFLAGSITGIDMTLPEREFFWNIDHQWVFYSLAAIAVGIFVYGIVSHIRVWFRGIREEKIHFSLRGIKLLFKEIIGGRIIKNDPVAGIMHLMILSGFSVLFAGTVLEAIDHYLVHFLYGRVYLAFSFALDTAGVILALGLAWAGVRRYIQRVERIDNRVEDLVVLLWLFVVVLTGFMVEALRLYITGPDWGSWSFAGYLFSSLFSRLDDAPTFYRYVWWFHAVLALSLVAVIPFCKLFHTLSAPLNIYLKTQPEQRIPIEMEKNPDLFFLTRDLVALDACTRCGRCVEVCPSHGALEPFAPRDMISMGKKEMNKEGLLSLFNGSNGFDTEKIWFCTTCGACESVCPVFVSPVSVIRTVRRRQIEGGKDVPPMLIQSLEKLYRYNNPWESNKKKRSNWAKGLDVTDITKAKEGVSLCYFVGCTTSFDTRAQEIARSFVRILHHAGVDFGILGKKEPCCGDIALRVGEDGLFEDHMTRCLSLFKRYGIKDIVTSSPHCFHTFKNDYPYYGAHLPGDKKVSLTTVSHYSMILEELLEKGLLEPDHQIRKRVTYHDPCYLGRHNGIFQAPREVISSIPGIELVEMKHHGENSLCCGGGGGRMWQEDLDGEIKMSEIRIQEAADTGAEILVTACPLCLIMLEDARKTSGLEDVLEVKDLNELLLMALGLNDGTEDLVSGS